MKKPPFIAAICSSLFIAAALPAFAQDAAPQPPDFSYFTKLRMDYSKRADFNPLWNMDDQRKAIIAAYKEATAATDAAAAAKAYTKVADLAKAWLVKCPVDSEAHFIRGQALIALGDIGHYAAERYFCSGLIQSVAASGDGQSVKTAFKVISGEEEYYLLGDFGAQPTGQSLSVPDSCDVVRCKLADGKEVTYYFDISIALAAESKQAEKKPGELRGSRADVPGSAPGPGAVRGGSPRTSRRAMRPNWDSRTGSGMALCSGHSLISKSVAMRCAWPMRSAGRRTQHASGVR